MFQIRRNEHIDAGGATKRSALCSATHVPVSPRVLISPASSVQNPASCIWTRYLVISLHLEDSHFVELTFCVARAPCEQRPTGRIFTSVHPSRLSRFPAGVRRGQHHRTRAVGDDRGARRGVRRRARHVLPARRRRRHRPGRFARRRRSSPAVLAEEQGQIRHRLLVRAVLKISSHILDDVVWKRFTCRHESKRQLVAPVST